jgi:hypothetical protein
MAVASEPVLNIAQGSTLKSVAKPTCWNGAVPKVAVNWSELPGPAVTPLSSRAPSTVTAPPPTVLVPFPVPFDGGTAHAVDVHPVGNAGPAPSNVVSSLRASSTEPGLRTTVPLVVPAEKSAAVSSVFVTVAAPAVLAHTGPTAAAARTATAALVIEDLLKMTLLVVRG